MGPLTSPEVEQQAAALVAQTQREDGIAAASVRVPLPGPTADVFAPCKDIAVGSLNVRPLKDGDFDILTVFGTPTAAYVAGVLDGREVQFTKMSRGLETWQVLYLVTRPSLEVWELLQQKDGLARLNKEARAQFGEMTYGQLAAFFQALVEQLRRYWAPVIAYGSAEEAKRAETEDENSRPPSGSSPA